MDKKPVIAQIYTWISKDFAEYWKLVGLSMSGTPNGIGVDIGLKLIRLVVNHIHIFLLFHQIV